VRGAEAGKNSKFEKKGVRKFAIKKGKKSHKKNGGRKKRKLR